MLDRLTSRTVDLGLVSAAFVRAPLLRMADPDVLEQLEHDHGPLSESVLTIREMIQTVRRGSEHELDVQFADAARIHATFAEAVGEFREDLLEHFGREEECLFPFLVDTLPDLRAAVEALESDHDQICGALVRLGYLAERDSFAEQFNQVVHTFTRFENAYLDHAAAEIALLRRADAALDRVQRAALRRAEQGLL
jgi:hypothetical protein